MKSLYSFIVKPLNSRYDNKKQIGDKTLIVNTDISEHKFVSKKAVVVSTPTAFTTDIKQGDVVYIHHNVFRRWYDMRGEEKNSSGYFKDDLYFVSIDQIYMHNLKCNLNYCFVKPIKEDYIFSTSKEKKYYGVLKYSNKYLEKDGVSVGDLVIFTPASEFEFIVEGERLYCMKSNDIAVTYGHQANKKENNPSWAKSC